MGSIDTEVVPSSDFFIPPGFRGIFELNDRVLFDFSCHTETIRCLSGPQLPIRRKFR